MKAADQQLLWKIKINAKANKFQFKSKATFTDPTFKLLKFSLFLKFYQFILHLKAEPPPSIPTTQTPTLKSKFLKIFHKFKISRSSSSEKAAVLQNPQTKVPLKRSENQEPICMGYLLVANVALLSKSILYEKDHRGIVIHGLSLALFFKKCVNEKARRTSLMMMMIFFTVFTVIIPSDKFIYHGNKNYYVFQLIWKGWKYVASSGCLYVISQAILSRFCQCVGVPSRSK